MKVAENCKGMFIYLACLTSEEVILFLKMSHLGKYAATRWKFYVAAV